MPKHKDSSLFFTLVALQLNALIGMNHVGARCNLMFFFARVFLQLSEYTGMNHVGERCNFKMATHVANICCNKNGQQHICQKSACRPGH